MKTNNGAFKTAYECLVDTVKKYFFNDISLMNELIDELSNDEENLNELNPIKWTEKIFKKSSNRLSSLINNFPAPSKQEKFNNFVFIVLQSLYYITWMKKCGEKCYYISENIHQALIDTEIDIECNNIKLPFQSFCIEFPEKIENQSTSDTHREYVNLSIIILFNNNIHISYFMKKEYNDEIIMVQLNTFQIDLNNNQLFESLESGESGTDFVKKIVNDETYNSLEEKEKESLKSISKLVFNCILYLTCTNADIMEQFPIPIRYPYEKISGNKRKQFDREHKKNYSSLPYYIVGGKIIPDNVQYNKDHESTGRTLNIRFKKKGFFRNQWKGHRMLGTYHQERTWVRDHWVGPEYADIVNKVGVVTSPIIQVSN